GLDTGSGRAGLLTVLKPGFGTALGVLLVTAGCGQQTVRMTPPEADASTTEVCSDLVSALPDTLMDADRAPIEPDTETMAAWGDPPIGLRCGVPPPSGLSAYSYLRQVDAVAWLPQPGVEPTLHTAVGRAAYVAVQAPPSYGPPAAALSTVSELIDEHVPPLPAGMLCHGPFPGGVLKSTPPIFLHVRRSE